MNIKKEVSINDNFSKNPHENDDINDYTFEEEPKLEENQNIKFLSNMDVKEEIVVKDEPLDFEEEDVEKGQLLDHISGLDENQRMKFFLNLDIKDEVEIKDEPLEFCEEELEEW
ncbi:hypothetical protein Anas_06058 [Armadillidium nasatum]|uniref:Uncharacterized protein n=1 Tax=Armadillidium nasatum TaxID=96803 RepID=A0A5N5TMV1_9CRUS|nr:hypothetical protein Anas_06058 [Armadillidium nasatum]